MKNQLTVILGAGFSANARMPMARDIARKFERDLREKLLFTHSGEWFWIDDKEESFIDNGSSYFSHLPYSYVFNELVKSYVSEKGEFGYYEEFYQYIIDNYQNDDWIEEIFNRAKELLVKDKPFLIEDNNEIYKEYLQPFEQKHYHMLDRILNYLIADTLSINIENEKLLGIYQSFIDLISHFEKVDIFTLNHDLLLEQILELNDLEYSKGFDIKNSPLTHKNVPVPIFTNTFDKRIKIYKLHGSLDFFKYIHYQDIGGWQQSTGDYDYYMPESYSTKHNLKRINPETKEIIQRYNDDIVPKFITGMRKLDFIKEDFMFHQLFENFKEIILKSENLFVSGYSFGDKYLNEVIESKAFNFINQNPSKEYPFEGNGKNIKSLDELEGFDGF